MDTKYLVALNAHQKIGSQTLKKALAPFSSNPERLWRAGDDEIRKKLDERIASLIIEARNKYDPEDEIRKLEKFNVGYITYLDKSYPDLLSQVYDCPAVLYIKGNSDLLNSPMLGVVGSRKYSNYGKTFSYKLAKECAESGLTIISGLALGIDTYAHQAALDCGGKTVGVLGCGLDMIYPVSNFGLAKSILENDGAIISEFPIGVQPMKQNFPARNRIIAGLSSGVLVVEAAEKSGALITAYQAVEYNREVFALPGNIDCENSIGTNKLIQSGAKLVLSADDILVELNIAKKKSEHKVKAIIEESNDEKSIIDVLKKGDRLINDLVKECGLNIVAVNSALSILEMRGRVQNLGGGIYHILA